jgi:hypothetical protein
VPITMILIFRDPCEFWGSFWFSCQRQAYADVVMICLLGFILVSRSMAVYAPKEGGGALPRPTRVRKEEP